jgi:restriction system protein
MMQMQREAERRKAAELRGQTQAARAAERAHREYERAQQADAKERARLYAEARSAEVDRQNEELEYQVEQLSKLLMSTLSVDDYFDLETLKERSEIPVFNPGSLAQPAPAPVLEQFLPAPPSGLKKLMPGAKEKHVQEVTQAEHVYQTALCEHKQHEEQRLHALAEAHARHERMVDEIRTRIANQHAEIDEFKRSVKAGEPNAVVSYFSLVLESSVYPDGFPQHAKLAYVPESKQLVIEYDLPSTDIVPDVAAYKYVKSKDEISSSPRSAAQRKALYAAVIAQVAVRTLHEIFEADRNGNIETIVFNGYVDTIDPGTGRSVRPCLVTVRTTREVFVQLDLSRVDPVACLKALNASVSKSPTELAPVRPVLEFSMVDPRFIEETDVLSSLDQRPNLMDLSPSEFESLITNLFTKMGLETKLTQASRDGGVDCVAYDPRPIFGGKVVIQAKRYKDTVGVSAVRDLFGTVQNEGASKGILVTTSGYGTAAFEFAEGKPLELLSGSNLLHLLAEHAGIEAKIVMPNT